MARIYTKTGDKGETGLIGGSRVRKDAPRIAALGDVDETNAAIGCAAADCDLTDVSELLTRIQSQLFDLGAQVAQPSPSSPATFASQIAALEGAIDRYQDSLEPLRNFILPGGTALAARLHLARSVCRRAERSVVALGDAGQEGCVMYLNRLSDLLFVLARTANRRVDVSDVKWTQEDIEG